MSSSLIEGLSCQCGTVDTSTVWEDLGAWGMTQLQGRTPY
jgi:hypothetical protein